MKKLSVIFLAVVMSVIMVVPAFASDNYGFNGPSIESYIDNEQYPYITIIQMGTTVKMYRSTEKLAVAVSDSSNKVWYPESGKLPTGEYKEFPTYYVSNDVWKQYGSSIFATEQGLYLWSNYDVYDLDGNLVYTGWKKQVTLAESIIDLAGDTINKDTLPSVSSAMTILCVTGVGLLAMLVLLKLFGKRSLIKR